MAQTCKRGPSEPPPQAHRLQCCDRAGELLEPDFFRALCDPTRLGVLLHLAELGEPATVSRVAECCTVDLSVVSRHLRVLRDAEIVSSEKRGKEVFYRLHYGSLAGTLRKMADAIEACCPPDPTRYEEKRA